MVKYSLKVGKEVCEVEHSGEETFEEFQAKVFAVTDIPPKNQKVLCKSKMVKVYRGLCRIIRAFLLSLMELS